MKNTKVRNEFMEKEIEEKDYKPWLKELRINEKGKIEASLSNIVKILKMDKTLSGIAYNENKNALYIRGENPWRRIKECFTENDMANIKSYIEKHIILQKIIWSLRCSKVSRKYI